MDLTMTLDRLQSVVDRARALVESRRQASCSGCAAPCCRVGRNGMLISPLEAALLSRRISEDPELSRRRVMIEDALDAVIAAHGLQPSPDRASTYDCPFLVAGGGCLAHGDGQPLGCATFMPTTADQEHCDQDEEVFMAVFDELTELNDAVFGEGWEPWPIPVALSEHWKNAQPPEPGDV